MTSTVPNSATCALTALVSSGGQGASRVLLPFGGANASLPSILTICRVTWITSPSMSSGEKPNASPCRSPEPTERSTSTRYLPARAFRTAVTVSSGHAFVLLSGSFGGFRSGSRKGFAPMRFALCAACMMLEKWRHVVRSVLTSMSSSARVCHSLTSSKPIWFSIKWPTCGSMCLKTRGRIDSFVPGGTRRVGHHFSSTYHRSATFPSRGSMKVPRVLSVCEVESQVLASSRRLKEQSATPGIPATL
ncbi:hypothetical protein [Streptomyces sp. NPDC037389]|uniref:hypothetical protein n=1 Tax=Streptomyces sp. NPDC037389 TaxID=3155369 RepID=UPI0033F91A07